MADFPKESSLCISMDILQTHTQFAVDQHQKMSGVFATGRSANSIYCGLALREQHNLQNIVGIVSKETGAASVGN